jgi:uncharacterized protein (DUF1800 family)
MGLGRAKRHTCGSCRSGELGVRGIGYRVAAAALLLAACSVQPSGTTGPKSAAEAGRFLSQASFGADEASISSVRASGYADWIDQQIVTPPSATHLAFMDARLIKLRQTTPTATLSSTDFYYSFWKQAADGPDQLRQRVKLALSEIFVISLADPAIDVRGAASYYDMLGASAFGNYRTLLDRVTLHPMMGVYLTWMANQKEDAVRHPDENYAREVMQLMTIGLWQLNPDGTQKLSNGAPIPAYTTDDIAGLAKVFTGYSWYHSAPTNNNTFFGRNRHAEATIRPMIAYPAYHSVSEKRFLGQTIPASGTVQPAADLKLALDTLFEHPNTPPFICKQLIQRLVTSNPSPAYVQRVSAVFIDNGRGVRGDLAAVVRAILLDAEARQEPSSSDLNYGKVREPIVRMAHWMRAFDAQSQSGDWMAGSTSANTSLNQSALTSPSVFNFFRPGYSPPNTRIGGQGLVAPELQIVDEVSIAGYLNTMQTTVDAGIGATEAGRTGRDVRSTYAAEMAIASDVPALVDRMNLLLMSGQMSPALRSRITSAVGAVAIPGGTATQTQINTALLNRSKLAIFMTMASPEYVVQR